MLRIKGLSVGIKREKDILPVFNGLNIDIPKGGITVITGESGIGKTVFAKTISGLLPENFVLTGGLFYINNRETDYCEIKKLTGKGVFYAPQNAKTSLNPVLKIKTQYKDIKNKKYSTISSLMRELEFDDPERIMNSYPFELSEGECQRIIFIMGILLKPDLFILDEPTSALDITTQKKLLDIILRVNQTHKITILLITHNLSLLNINDHAGNSIPIYHFDMSSFRLSAN